MSYTKEYLEQIKKKLDDLNKASGVNPELNREIQRQNSNSSMPSNEIFDMLGNGYKIWKEKKENGEL